MQPIVLPLAALALLGAAEPPAPQPPAEPVPAIREVVSIPPPAEHCRDRITHAREASGLPPLMDRGPASADNPYLIYAVDKRVDGCAVMVMKGNVKDIRPLPPRPEGPVLLLPAKGK
jgi:hypothetical protein